jgi:DinB superfamily
LSLPAELVAIVVELERGPEILGNGARRLPEPRWRRAPTLGGFCLVEHAWHMADLEREGFSVRLRRLREESEPFLPDFDGDRAARERHYAARALDAGIAAFAAARAANLALLRELVPAEWTRAGTQQGVGRLTLAEVPGMMLRHDRQHAAEIAALVAEQ